MHGATALNGSASTPGARAYTLLVLVTLTTLVLAGCMANEAPDATEADASSNGSTQPSTNSGADLPPGRDDPAANATAGEALIETVALVFDGRADGQFCPFVTNCHQFDEGENVEPALDAPGALQRVTATVTWDADTPATEELAFYVIVETDDGGRAWDQGVAPARGTSPLDIAFALGKYAGRDVWIRASSLKTAVAAPQDFHFDGLIHYAAANATAADADR